MHLFFLIQSHLLIFCIDDQQSEANLDRVLLFSPVTSSKLINFKWTIFKFFNRTRYYFAIKTFYRWFFWSERTCFYPTIIWNFFIIQFTLSKFIVCDSVNYMFNASKAYLFFYDKSIYWVRNTFFRIRKCRFFTYRLFFYLFSTYKLRAFYLMIIFLHTIVIWFWCCCWKFCNYFTNFLIFHQPYYIFIFIFGFFESLFSFFHSLFYLLTLTWFTKYWIKYKLINIFFNIISCNRYVPKLIWSSDNLPWLNFTTTCTLLNLCFQFMF